MVTEPRSLAGLFLRPRAVQPGAQAETRTVGRGSLRDHWVCGFAVCLPWREVSPPLCVQPMVRLGVGVVGLLSLRRDRQALYGNMTNLAPLTSGAFVWCGRALCNHAAGLAWPPSRSGATASAKDIPAGKPTLPHP
jgi:hypothetical protein